MAKTKIGLMVVASRFESGGERAEDLGRQAREMLAKEGYEVAAAAKTVWDAADALAEAERIAAADPDLLLVIHATWVLDSLQYLLVNTVKRPLVMWAVPYTETFSIGCVQHFGSILRQQGLSYGYLYGSPGEEKLRAELAVHAAAARAYRAVRQARIALLGPRQTWRVANSQDMTGEEWEFSRTFGSTIVHIEMEELLDLAGSQDEAAAGKALTELRRAHPGKSLADESRLLYAARVYLGVKGLFARYGLTAAAAECYPNYSGLVNLPSSWLADEGIVLDTEGDIGHTAVMLAMNEMAPGATALAEVGSFDEKTDSLWLAHEGSSAHSLAGDQSKVQVSPSGETGSFVGLPLKPMPTVTVSNLCGLAGKYRMLIATGATEPIAEQEWIAAGSKFVAKLKPAGCARAFFDRMLAAGADHHLLLREGDLTRQLAALCDLFGVEKAVI